MAIIYTYPRLSNPDGTELVVVSETKNQNATRLIALSDIAALVPSTAGGTITGVKVDFASHGIDTGLRLWNAGFTDTFQDYITGAATFEIGGILRVGFGGTGLSTYLDGDVLYYDSATSTEQLVPLAIGAASEVLTVDAITGFPVWSTVSTGTMSNWIIDGTLLGTTAQTITQGEVVTLVGGTVIDTIAGFGITSQVTINHAPISSSVSTNNITLTHGGTFTAIDLMGISGEAHVVSHNTTTFTLPPAGGSTGHGFSPCPVAISGIPVDMDNTHHYLTVAEHTMDIEYFMLWGNPAPTLSSGVEFALYKAGTGPTTWSAATLAATGTTPAIPPGWDGSIQGQLSVPVSVTVGENLIVGLRRTSGDWDTIGDDGADYFAFGVVEVGSVAFVSSPPVSGGAPEASSTRFALTLF